MVERLARQVRGSSILNNNFHSFSLSFTFFFIAQAIPGGSEEILLDFAIRDAVAKAKKLKSKM